MIIIKLQGGLGNQLFQYGLGRVIEEKFNKEVKYDISFFNENNKFTKRVFSLDKYTTRYKLANKEEIKKVKYPLGVISIIVYFIKKIINKFFIKKYHISYEENFLESIADKDNMYLEGYFQSFRYINDYLTLLRNEITLESKSPSFEKLEEEINRDHSLAIHIRRGDYLNKRDALQALDISYYENANKYFLNKTISTKYYIFTDDPKWVKENFEFLKENNPVYVSDLGFHDYEELLLMSSCKNIIIANSSFSWWGAILNTNKGIIICPSDWKNSLLKNDSNLCPEEWVRV